MSVYLVQQTFEASTLLPEDAVVNTWHAECSSDANAIAWAAFVRDFYGTDPTGFTESVEDYMSIYLTGNVTEKIFDLSDPTPRVPVSIDTWTIVPNALDAGLPEETCICFSQKAAYVSGINPQSQRGRVYIGPLASG